MVKEGKESDVKLSLSEEEVKISLKVLMLLSVDAYFEDFFCFFVCFVGFLFFFFFLWVGGGSVGVVDLEESDEDWWPLVCGVGFL